MKIEIIRCLKDNYSYVIIDEMSKTACVVDPSEATPIIDFIEKKKIEFIDLLKIDTEGYELNVLKGLIRYNKKVKLIYFEHHYDDMIIKNYKFKDIHKLLKDYGFIKIRKSKMLFRKSFEYIYENKKN